MSIDFKSNIHSQTPSQDDGLQVDVLVAGAGNAGLCAALAALEAGVESVMILEKAPKRLRGGNTAYTGFYRFPYASLDDLRTLCPIDDELFARMNVEPYFPDSFYDDLVRPTAGKADTTIMRELADEAWSTMQWLTRHGMQWEVSLEGAREADGKLNWQPGTVVRPIEKGLGVLKHLYGAVGRAGGQLYYQAGLVDLTQDATGAVDGAIVKTPNGFERISAGAVVLAAGGFEASKEMRARYLGRGWDVAKIRGTRFNTGEALSAALRVGAATSGEWTGCHATMVHASAPPVEMGEEVLFPLAYPFGVIVDSRGQRFMDEGEHFYLKTYAKLGKEILFLPGGKAYQIFDSKTKHLMTAEGAGDLAYAVPHHEANSLGELAAVAGIAEGDFVRTIEKYNAAVQPGDFDASRLDGKHTAGLTLNKTNWALPIDTAPFSAYPVECGITFTYGGVQTDTNGQAIDTSGEVIPGLYAVGELAGTFYYNYAGGSGLTKGAVFGRRAGAHAATMAQQHQGSM